MSIKEKRLSKQERAGKDFIDLAFDCHEGEWMDTSNRLLDAFKGKYFSKYENKDRFTVNTIFSLVNLLLPNFIIQQPYIQVKPKQARYYKKDIFGDKVAVNNVRAAQIREIAINNCYAKIGAINEDRKAVQDAFFYGFGICKTGYSYETLTGMDKDYIVKDSPFHKRVCPKDFGWHPLATGLDDSIKLVNRLVTTRARLKGNRDIFKNLDDLPAEVPQHLKDKISKSRAKAFEDYITLYEVLDQERDEYYYYAGESKLFIGKIKRKYLFNGPDYSMIRFAQDNDEFLGIPLLAMVEDECIALNEVMTMMIEHMRKFPGMVFIEEGAADEDQIEAMRTGEQGSIHIVKTLTDGKIQFKSPLNMGGEYFNIVGLLQSMLDRILGVPDFQRAAGSNRKSATEASYIQGDATVRRAYYLNLVKEFVLDGVEKVAAIQSQHQDKYEEVLVRGEFGEQTFKYNKDDLQGEYQFTFDVDNMAYINQAEATNLTNMLNVLGAHQVLHPVLQSLDPHKVGKELFKRMNLNIEALTNTEPENMAHVPPERENAIALSGSPMPQPKKGEDHESHLAVHMAALQEGWNEQIADHIAATQMLQQEEGKGKGSPPVGMQQAPSVDQQAMDMAPGVNQGTEAPLAEI